MIKKQKILIVTTISKTIQSFLIPHIQFFQDKDYEVSTASRDSDLLIENELKKIKKYEIPFQRKVFHYRNFLALKNMKRLMQQGNFDFVYLHTPVASAITRMALLFLKKRPRIVYFAHGFHFNQTSFGFKQYAYYVIEKMLSNITDDIICINEEDYQLSKEKFKKSRTHFFHGVGIDLSLIPNTMINTTNKKNSQTKILSVGELNTNKNHILVLRALLNFKEYDYTYTICGEGPLHEKLREFIAKNQLEEKVFLKGYCDQIKKRMKDYDLLIHPSKREGLPVSIMEAMAAGIDILASDIRGNRDLIKDQKGGILFNNNVESLMDGLSEYFSKSETAKDKMKKYNYNKIQSYTIENVLKELDYVAHL